MMMSGMNLFQLSKPPLGPLPAMNGYGNTVAPPTIPIRGGPIYAGQFGVPYRPGNAPTPVMNPWMMNPQNQWQAYQGHPWGNLGQLMGAPVRSPLLMSRGY